MIGWSICLSLSYLARQLDLRDRKVTWESSYNSDWSKPPVIRTQAHNLNPDKIDSHVILWCYNLVNPAASQCKVKCTSQYFNTGLCHQMSFFVWQTQNLKYTICYNVKPRKDANSHIWEPETIKCWYLFCLGKKRKELMLKKVAD